MIARSALVSSIIPFVSILEAASVFATGCSTEPAGSDPTTTAGAHAAKDVKPGSHEDWCGEHGVPESQCTKCNPGLIPAFKATKDWCAEHGVPESQCTKCNPEIKITRPPKGS